MQIKKMPHQVTHNVNDKPFQVFWSKKAEAELQKRQQPLIVEMELKFACMVRMLVHFHDEVKDTKLIDINNKLQVFYRPVISQSCDISDKSSAPVMGELTTGPMAERFPRKLSIDFIQGEWAGKFS